MADAVRAVSVVDNSSTPTLPLGIRMYQWALLDSDDSGSPIEIPQYSDKTVHIFGTFGAAGSITMQGSNDPRVLSDPGNAVWTALTDPQGNAITKTAAAIEALLENPRFIRPLVTAGDGTTNLTVVVCAKKG